MCRYIEKEKSMNFYVYALLDPRKAPLDDFQHEPFYVGLGKGLRMFSHDENAPNILVRRKIRKILAAGLEVVHVKIRESLKRDEAASLEISLIEKYGKISNGSGILCNVADGGFGGDVLHDHPDRLAIYAKRNESMKNSKLGMYADDHGEKVSAGKKGIPLSTEHRKAISGEGHADVSGEKNPMWGKEHSVEAKRKMKAAKQKFLSDPVKRKDFFRRAHEKNPLRDKTYEEVYGKDRAEEIKQKRSLVMKEMRRKMIEKGIRTFVYNDELRKSRRVYECELSEVLASGWKRGRKFYRD